MNSSNGDGDGDGDGEVTIEPAHEAARNAWFSTALRLVDAARGNDRFVKVRAVRPLWAAWHDALQRSPESIPPLRLDRRTGLPPWSTWAELSAEQRLGASLVAASTTRGSATTAVDAQTATRAVSDARDRLHRREAAARALASVPALPLEPGRVEVRRVDGARAQVTLLIDRIDASGLLVRVRADVTVDVRRTSGGIAVRDDEAQATAAFVTILERSVGLPAAAIAVQLASSGDDVVVERVSRGVVGPLRAAAMGPALLPLATNDALLVLSLEELHGESHDVVDNDVFATDELITLWHALPKELRRLTLFRDARVVATAGAGNAVRALSSARKKKTVVTIV